MWNCKWDEIEIATVRDECLCYVTSTHLSHFYMAPLITCVYVPMYVTAPL